MSDNRLGFEYDQGTASVESNIRSHNVDVGAARGEIYVYATFEMGSENPVPYVGNQGKGTQIITLGEKTAKGFVPSVSFGLSDVFRGGLRVDAVAEDHGIVPSGGRSMESKEAFLTPFAIGGELDYFGPFARPNTLYDFKIRMDMDKGRMTIWTNGRGDDDWFMLVENAPLMNAGKTINHVRVEQAPGAKGISDVMIRSKASDAEEQVRTHPLAKKDRVVGPGKGFKFQSMRSIWGLPGRHVAVSRKGNFHHAFPDIAQSGPKSLIAVWSNRSHSGGTGGLSVALSDDLGKTWCEGALVHPGKANCPRIQRLKDGTLLLMSDVREREEYSDTVLYDSSDGGKTWGNQRWIRAERRDGYNPCCGEPSRVVESPDGSWLVETATFGGTSANVTKPIRMEFYHSTDRGTTWELISKVSAFQQHHLDEASFFELPDGQLVTYAREWRYDALPGTKAFSDDWGKTWKVHELPFSITGRVCAGLLADGRAMVTFRSGIGRAALWAWVGDPLDPTGFQPAGTHFNDRSSVALKDDSLHIDNDGKLGQFTQYFLRPADTSESIIDVTVEVNVVSNSGRGAILSVPYVGKWRLFPDHVELAHDPAVCVKVTPGGFHVYRVIRESGKATLYVDGKLAVETENLDTRTWREAGVLNTSSYPLAFGNDADWGNAHTNVYPHDIMPDVTGYSIWRRAEETLDDPTTGKQVISWSAGRDGFPDQYQLDHIIQIEASATGGDQGYSGWIQLDDGRIFVVNYTDDTAPMVRRDPYDTGMLGIPWIRGTFLLPSDLPPIK